MQKSEICANSSYERTIINCKELLDSVFDTGTTSQIITSVIQLNQMMQGKTEDTFSL